MAKRPRGYIPSPFDHRDRRVNQLIGGKPMKLPSASSLLSLVDFMNDQGKSNSCVLNAIQQLHYVASKRGGIVQPKRISRLFGYYNSRLRHGMADIDLGTIPREAFKAISGLGMCEEGGVWPFDLKKVNQKPTPAAYRAAFDQKWLTGYYAVWEPAEDRIAAIQRALAQGHGVVLAMQIGDAFENYKSGLIGPTVDIDGGHMVYAAGYDQEGLWIVNSWGEDWGTVPPELEGRFRGGFGKLAWETVAWSGISEVWAASWAVEFSS
jgi:hypothetical protein